MSLSATSAPADIAAAAPDPTIAVSASVAASEPGAQTVSVTQPILIIPTKPPLSPAIMAELIGRQASLDGSPAGDRRLFDGAVTLTTDDP
jgi:hypothetical protein